MQARNQRLEQQKQARIEAAARRKAARKNTKSKLRAQA
jgi:hypothetical protein